MKTYFKSDEIAHVWAHKSAPRGTCPASMSFNGDAFLSYWTEIARHITHKGQSAVILNDTSYSATTSGHQSSVRQAVTGPVFHISGINQGSSLRDVTGKDLFQHALEMADNCQKSADKARTRKDSYLGEKAQWLERAQRVNEFFGLRRKVDQQAIDRLRKETEAAKRKTDAERARREEETRQKQSVAYALWKDSMECDYFDSRLFPVAFRVESDELVSTMGARVPLAAARTAYRFVTSRRATGWHRNGETCPVGNYALDAINEQGIVAGCHRISWAEIERLAPVLSA